jgi:SAM-dependent methyltransferase
VKLHENIRVLDFGCGVGRQLLHFTRNYPNPAYFACDVDDTSVAFISRNYPGVQAHTNGFSPPLDYPAGHFDMVYAVSIFSHLAPADHEPWLAELARITKPGGCCFLTTEGYTALPSLAGVYRSTAGDLREQLNRKGCLYREYDYYAEAIRTRDTLRSTSLLVGVEGSYGNTVLSPEYIREHWSGSGLEVVDIVEGVIDHRQDLVVLRRSPNTFKTIS